MKPMKGKRKHIRTRIMSYFGIVLILISICLVIFYELYMHNLRKVTMESMESVLSKINLDTSLSLAHMEEAANLFARDRDIQQALREELPDDEKTLYSQRLDFMSRLRYTIGYVSELEGIYVVGENGARFRSSFSSMLPDDFRESDWYREVKETHTARWSLQETGSFMARDVHKPTISIVVPVIDRAAYDHFLGTVTVDVRVEDLQQLGKNGMVFDGYLLILDKEKQILYTDMPQTEELEQALADEKSWSSDGKTEEISIGKEKYLFLNMRLDTAGWYLAGLVPVRSVFGGIYRLRNMSLLMMAVAIALAIWLSILASRRIAYPILLVRKAMRQAEEGDMDVQAEIITNDEVGALAKTFNHMLGRIRNLIQERHEQDEKLRIAEFKSLQAQINPHFLYNTLDSINWMARAGKTDEVSSMINSLSIFFRISLSRGRTFITVGEEVKHALNYILIQQKRYEKYLEYEIDVPQELEHYLCLKMILQPLVENALYHGIKEKGEKGVIRIKAEASSAELIFTVCDTGKGMSPEKLRELQYMMDNGIEYNKDAYGVINVQRRIQTYFGQEYGLNFASVLGEGTTVTVRIPLKETEDEKDVEDRDR